MNYVAQSRSPQPAAIFGALGIPAAVGFLLVTGLAVSGVIDDEKDRLITIFVDDDKVEPPPPPPKPDETKKVTPNPRSSTQQRTVTPENAFNMNGSQQGQNTSLPQSGNEVLFGEGPIGNPGGLGEEIGNLPIEIPTLFDPVPAKPKGNPGSWVTDNDYRPSWVRREMSGTARFSLEISASGRVTLCTITGSTGHSALDTATCSLIQMRARFEPARDSSGDNVAGSYSNSVAWRLP